MELDPITTAALEVLGLKPDRLPHNLYRLAELVSWKNPPEYWTDHKTSAYNHLRQVLKARKPHTRLVVQVDNAPLTAGQVRSRVCAN
jgi:hypothetical protein